MKEVFMLKIEFFHDVICSFCFPMSLRMRKIKEKFSNIEIQHRSFALGWDETVFSQMFGSHEAVKEEVLGHWDEANRNDDDHRFNIEGMRAADFLFPTSKPGLLACKAAGLVEGQDAYWEVFDKLQEGLFVKNLNIADPKVIEALVKETSVDFKLWKKQLEDENTQTQVIADLGRVRGYNIQGAPALVINQKYLITGARSQEYLESALQEIAEKEGVSLTGLQTIGEPGESCRIEDGQWICD